MANRVSEERVLWIDCLKLFACAAVFVDHTSGFLYRSDYIMYASYFSVPVFIFLSGITGFKSYNKHMSETYRDDINRRLVRILIPYAIAAACYILYTYRFFDLKNYLLSLIRFNASAPFYFLVIYIQLTLIGRGLCKLINLTGEKTHFQYFFLIEIIFSLIISELLIKYTYVLPIHGGGKYLFGGTYLFLYFGGMIFGKYHNQFVWGGKSSRIVCFCSIAAAVLWVAFMVNNKFQLDEKMHCFGSFNPPGITLSIYTGIIILFCWSLDTVIQISNNKWINKIWSWISKGGKYSLYIFLFHMLFLSVFQTRGHLIQNIWLKRAACVLFVFGGCSVFGIVIDSIMKEYAKK